MLDIRCKLNDDLAKALIRLQFLSNWPTLIMSAFRVARSALRLRPSSFRAPVQTRSYADVASDKIKLSLTLPHEVRRFLRSSSWFFVNSLLYRPFSKAPMCMSIGPTAALPPKSLFNDLLDTVFK